MAFFANEPDDKGVQACPVGMCRVVPESTPACSATTVTPIALYGALEPPDCTRVPVRPGRDHVFAMARRRLRNRKPDSGDPRIM